jgi:hypothetical protein
MPSSQLNRVEKSIEAMRSDPHRPKTAETTEALQDLVYAVRAVESQSGCVGRQRAAAPDC